MKGFLGILCVFLGLMAAGHSQMIPGEVGAIKFDEITMSQVKVSWEPPKERDDVLLGYQISYGMKNDAFSDIVKQMNNDNYLEVSGLKERVTYTFMVQAGNSFGLGPEKTGNVTTGPQPGSPLAPFEVFSVPTRTFLLLKWKNPTNREPILGYIIEANNLGKQNALEWQPVVTLRNGQQASYELSYSRLSPFSAYKFRLMSFNKAGVSEPAYLKELNGGAAVITTPARHN